MNTQTSSIQEVVARVVGVTYEGRQTVVAKLVPGEEVFLLRDPHNPYDSNAVKVVNRQSQQVGFLARELAERLAAGLDRLGTPVSAKVNCITGGYAEWTSLGVQIRFPWKWD